MAHEILIAGCGYVGTAVGQRLAALGHHVWAMRRNPAGLPAAFNELQGDLTRRADLDRLPRALDYVLFSVSAGEHSDAAYERAYVAGLRNLLDALGSRAVRRVFFTSSTAVYAQTGGVVVDEDSETAPTHFSGRRTLEAEALLHSSAIPATVLRCSGIYGPGRTRLIDAVREGKAPMSPRLTNRIHRDDIAGAIAHIIERDLAPSLLLLTDDEPAPQRDVTAFIAARLGVPAPPEAAAPAGARGGDKRCSNARLRAAGYQLLYPTYREGYAAMLQPSAAG